MVIEDVRYPKKPNKKSDVESKTSSVRYMAAPIDRLASTMADVVLLVPLCSLFVAPFRKRLDLAIILRDTGGMIEAAAFFAGAVVLAIVTYQTIFLSRWGTTPGKWILGLRVASVHGGEKPSPKQAALRSWFWCVGLFLGMLPWVGVISNVKRRPWHDRIADTEVYVTNPKHGVLPPDQRELAYASSIQSMTLSVFLAFFVSVSMQVAKINDENVLHVGASGGAHEYLCDAVTNAYQEWLTRDAHKPTRMEVALTLFASEAIDDGCLETEAEYSLWSEKDKSLGYFAKALAEADDEETSVSYAKRVCETKNQEALCRLAKLTVPAYEKSQTDKSVDKLLQGPAHKEAFYSAFIIRELMSQNRFSEALALIDKGSTQNQSAYFYSMYRAQALWGLHKKDEARLAVRSAIDGLAWSERVQLTRWACEVESATSCTAEALSSCELLSGAIQSSPGELEDKELALTWVRAEECLAGTKVDYQKMKTLAPGEDLQAFIKALEQERNGQVQSAKQELHNLLKKVEPETPIWFEVQTRLTALASAAELSSIHDEWAKSEEKASSGYSRLGSALKKRITVAEDTSRMPASVVDEGMVGLPLERIKP